MVNQITKRESEKNETSIKVGLVIAGAIVVIGACMDDDKKKEVDKTPVVKVESTKQEEPKPEPLKETKQALTPEEYQYLAQMGISLRM